MASLGNIVLDAVKALGRSVARTSNIPGDQNLLPSLVSLHKIGCDLATCELTRTCSLGDAVVIKSTMGV